MKYRVFWACEDYEDIEAANAGEAERIFREEYAPSETVHVGKLEFWPHIKFISPDERKRGCTA